MMRAGFVKKSRNRFRAQEGSVAINDNDRSIEAANGIADHPNRMGRRMLKEGLRRIRESGFDIAIVDPDGELEDRTMSDGTQVPKGEPEDYMINGEPV